MIYKKLNHCLIFIILSLVNRIVYGQFIPGPHMGTQAVLFDNKIYYIGGVNYNEGIVTNSDVFYYDNGAPFGATGLLPWVDLESQVKIPLTAWHSVSLGGNKRDLIFIIGGARIDETTSYVYQVDPKTNTVSSPTIQGTTPQGRIDIDAVNYEGKIYIFGGRMLSSSGGVITFFDNFDILNTISMTWEVGSLVNAPVPRYEYTATLVNEVIYYIGGIRQGQTFESMSNIYQYNIVSNTWSAKIATAAVGFLPQGRMGHTAVYFNGKICIYGGRVITAGTMTTAQGVMVLLDTTTLQWSTPSQLVNNNSPRIDDIPKLCYHTATLIDKNTMFLAFGNFTDNAEIIHINYYYYKFDLEKFQWVRLASNGEGNPKGPDNSTDPSTLTKPVIIGLSVGLAIAGLSAIAAFIFIYYKHMKKKIQLNNADGIASENMNQRFESPPTSRYPSSYQLDYRQSLGQEFATLREGSDNPGSERPLPPRPPSPPTPPSKD